MQCAVSRCSRPLARSSGAEPLSASTARDSPSSTARIDARQPRDSDELKNAVDAALTRGNLEEAKASTERHAALTGRAKASLELLAVVAKARGDNDSVTKLHDEIERGAI